MRLPRIIRYVWTAFGLIPFWVGTVGIAWGIYALSFSLSALRTEGKVISNRLVTGVDGDGRSHRLAGGTATDPPSFKVGEPRHDRWQCQD